ncbi:conjugal transfer protein TraI [Mucilaginibacter ginsenosidivorans]|uniref:Conjugal transfer protein TraI n=1 Tax=Mucilaginibacter ginsenosidivorans TaxID=398053 RepID=A0A5B8UTN3_9SPHI|nr:conjugal transfer protein TraI [Mucilaginibacter ginsenosidivorans]QEC62470.1 conjugal transfer protein TraI [Mucilaginibacter ginsenosidivorans]
MKRNIVLTLLFCCLAFAQRASAQVPVVSLVTGIIKKVIIAIDLKVQQLQNQLIALQSGEQQLENNLHLNSLNDISGWLNKEKDLYADYYQELATVRKTIADYDAVKRVISSQKQLVWEYQRANALFHSDAHFSPSELSYMGNIFNGILTESLRDVETVTTAITDFGTQMDDAERWQRIDHAAKAMQTNLDHLRQFNRQNVQLSFSRSRDEADRRSVRRLYGIN